MILSCIQSYHSDNLRYTQHILTYFIQVFFKSDDISYKIVDNFLSGISSY